MDDGRIADEIIYSLSEGRFLAECPCCNEPISLDRCGLFYLDDFTAEARKVYEQYQLSLSMRKAALAARRRQISQESEGLAKATNVGLLLERLAPSLRTFRFECSDCRSLFDPIDYLIFEGLCGGTSVSRIIFAEIKTGGSRLSQQEREIRELVHKKRVEFDTYEVSK